MDPMDIAEYEDISVRDGLAESLRLPLVRGPYPRWCYITAVVVAPGLWEGVMPTGDELRMVASYHEEYCFYWYGPPGTGHRVEMEKRPYDIDRGANGRILIKRPNGGWAYRYWSWRAGPILVPSFDQPPATLPELLDRASGNVGEPSERWLSWKAAHPEVFGNGMGAMR